MRKSKVYQVSDDEFQKIIQNSYSYSECLRKLGLTDKGGTSTKILKERILELNCSIEHFSRTNSNVYKKYSTEEILVENSLYTKTSRLKERLIKEGLLEERCSICGLGPEWNGKILVLQLDHINGVHNDNRLENLRIVCPNCHSQTDTYAGKNNKGE